MSDTHIEVDHRYLTNQAMQQRPSFLTALYWRTGPDADLKSGDQCER